MKAKDYIIKIDEGSAPYNVLLVLPLPLLELLTPLLIDDIMLGAVETLGDDKVVLHLYLSCLKIEQLKALIENNEPEIALAG